jgi:hypothetical protein
MNKKLYCLPLVLCGTFPQETNPSIDEGFSVEIGGSTMAYPQVTLRLNHNGRTETQIRGWVVVCTDMDMTGLEIFLNRKTAIIRTSVSESGLEDVITVLGHYQMLVVDLDDMTSEVLPCLDA